MRRTYLFVFYLLIFSTLFGLPGKAASQRATMVRVHPAEITMSPGESHTVEVWVDDVEDLWAFALEISFDPAALTVSDLEAGGFLSTEPGRFQIFVNEVDPVQGLISFVMTQWRVTATDPLPRDGSGVLISFQILAKQHPGNSSLSVDQILLSDKNGVEIPTSVADGTVQIIGDDYFVYLPLISH